MNRIFGDPLSVTHPSVSALWHPDKNGVLTPADVTARSNRRVWWRCPKADDHEWEAMIYNVTISADGGFRGNGCPCCHGKKVVRSNCLATSRPDVASLWHPSRNGVLTPEHVTPKSHRRSWWQCPVDASHEWDAVIAAVCNAVASGCPYCNGKRACRTNSLATVDPRIASLWHPSRNGDLMPDDVVASSGRKVWWKCPVADDHEWDAAPNTVRRSPGNGCPYCRGLRVARSNCLATTHPDVARLWHPTKNGEMTPFDVTANNTTKAVWLQCADNPEHEWKTFPNWLTGNMANGSNGCPRCRESRGERRIRDVLASAGVRFEPQYSFAGCKHQARLPFDFAVFSGDRIFLIEYQGEQHYRPVPRGRGESEAIREFAKVRKRDDAKRAWCESNDVPLLLVPYWGFDRIEKIVTEWLSCFITGSICQ